MYLSFIVLAIALICVFGENFFDFSVDDGNGNTVSLEKYSSSKVILVVNTASFCGYTQRNYKQLQDIYTRLHPQGLEILAFPCNQFGAQEPYGYSEIVEYVTSNFAVSFPVLGKLEVNGDKAHPLYKYLKSSTDGRELNWNFNKFLVVNGEVIQRYSADVDPFDIEEDFSQYFSSEL